jgi:crotonobetainyl-CoA:carnitine CoA-transferase CaiB-like acyl-CoA transferase
MKTRMLEGYKVLDFTQALAGPTATRYLAQMGAEVIKVELAPNGDLARAVPFMRDGRSATTCSRIAARRVFVLTRKSSRDSRS